MRLILLSFSAIVALTSCSGEREIPSSSSGNVMSFEDFTTMEKLSAKRDRAESDPTCDSECQSRRQEFRYVVYVGKEIYCYWDEKRAETGTDFEALAQSLESRITSATTPSQYFRILRTWAASFHDGHVNAMPKDLSPIEVYSVPVRFEVMAPATDHETVIIADSKDTPGASRGDIVVSVNGKPAREYVDLMTIERSGSTDRGRRFASGARISSAVGSDMVSDAMTLELKKADGTIRQISVQQNVTLIPAPTPGTPEPAPTTGVENFKTAILPGGIGYLRMDAFMGSQSEFLLDQALNYLSSTKGLLIDLRTNGGGDQSGNRLIRRVITSTVTRYRTSERMSAFVISARPDIFTKLTWTPGNLFADWHELKIEPATQAAEQYLNKPIVALTSPYCFSACDTFTSALKTNKLATIVGEGTGGGTGSPLVFDLPVTSGMQFRYSVVRGHTADDRAIEGVGTLPDIVIEPTVEERVAGKDEQLAKAVQIVLDRVNGQAHSEAPEAGALASAASDQIVKSFRPVWAQDLSEPTIVTEQKNLNLILSVDELSK